MPEMTVLGKFKNLNLNFVKVVDIFENFISKIKPQPLIFECKQIY